MPNATARTIKKTAAADKPPAKPRASRKKAGPTAVTVDDTVIAVTEHIDIADAADPDAEFSDWLSTADDDELATRLGQYLTSGVPEQTAAADRIVAELNRRDEQQETHTFGPLEGLSAADVQRLTALAEDYRAGDVARWVEAGGDYANDGAVARLGEWLAGQEPADAEVVDDQLTDNAAMEAFLGGADPGDFQAMRRLQAQADAQARQQAGLQWAPEETAIVGGVVELPVDDALAVSAEVFAETGVLTAVELTEGEVLEVEQIKALRAQGVKPPDRVYGTPIQQARQAAAWYDGRGLFPYGMAPDAGPEEWAELDAEEKLAQQQAAEAAALAEANEPGTYRTISEHPAVWSTEDGADPTVCVEPGCGAPRNQHVVVPAHVPTAAEWAETLRRAQENTTTAKAEEKKPEAKPKPKAAPTVQAADPSATITLDLTTAELALAWTTLGRFGYRAFDSWGDLIAPFAYADGTELPEKPTLPGNRVEALHKALTEHGTWLGKAKKADADRVRAVAALTTKIAGLLA